MANNWMKLVVDAPVSRLNVEGFRFDPDPSKPGWDQGADQDAWAIWQSNNMDGIAQQVHTEAIKCGVCNVLVSPSDGKHPLLTAEHPSQSYVQCSYIDRRQRLAAIKRWVDEIDEYGYAYVYLPDYVYRYRSVEKVKGYDISQVQWTSLAHRRRPGAQQPAGRRPDDPGRERPRHALRRALRPRGRDADPGRREQVLPRHAGLLGVPRLPAALGVGLGDRL
jgi:hypothetical protein